MVGARGFEFTRKRSFNNIERTAGTVKQWKAVVSSANGSQTDHGSVISRKALWRGGRKIDVPPCHSLWRHARLHGLPPVGVSTSVLPTQGTIYGQASPAPIERPAGHEHSSRLMPAACFPALRVQVYVAVAAARSELQERMWLPGQKSGLIAL